MSSKRNCNGCWYGMDLKPRISRYVSRFEFLFIRLLFRKDTKNCWDDVLMAAAFALLCSVLCLSLWKKCYLCRAFMRKALC